MKSAMFRPTTILLLSLVLLAGTAPGQERLDLHGLTREAFVEAKAAGVHKSGGNGEAAALSSRYDVLSYDLDLRIDPGNTSLDASVFMRFISGMDGLDEIVLDFTASDLLVSRVAQGATDLAFSQMLGDSLVVQLSSSLALDQEDSLLIEYAGQPVEPISDRGLVYKNYSLGGISAPIVASQSQPAYAKYWWPCKDRPDDKAYTTMRLTVPDTLMAVSNGTLISDTSPEPGWRTLHWKESYPMPTYLVSVAISNYQLLSESCLTPGGSDVPLRHWVFPPDATDALVEFEPVCEMMAFCEDLFGPYPFLGEKYGHAEYTWSGAMEHTTVTSIGYGSITSTGSRDWLVVHELGHQWFGDSLTPHTWADVWLNEGFATYTEALWREYEGGRETYLNYLDYWRDETTWAAQGPVYDPMPVFPGRVIYDKGSWILHMLRHRMGDTAFFGMVEEWANGDGRPGGTVTTAQFIAVAETWAGEDLDDFLWPYLEEPESPRIRFDYTLGEGDAGPGTELTVVLSQEQERLFDNRFPLFVSSGSTHQEFTVDLRDRTATAVYQLAAAPDSVRLDPEFSVLWRSAGSSGTSTGLLQAYPNPAREGYLTLDYRLEASADVVLSIYDARGRQVFSQDLGRVSPEPGANEISWNLRDGQGARVAAGVYWAALEINAQRSVRKFTVLP